MEPSPKRTATQLRRKPSFSSSTELEKETESKTDISRIARLSENNDHENEEETGVCKIEICVKNTSSSSRPVTPIMKTTKTRNVLRIARFPDHENRLMDGPKSADMKTFDKKIKIKLEDCMKTKSMGKCEELIRESEIGIRRAGGKKLDKYQVS